MRNPNLKNWKSWSFSDYQEYFLSMRAAKQRMRGRHVAVTEYGTKELEQFCAPIRQAIEQKFVSDRVPRVSIVIVAFNEERELIPTLVSYASLTLPDGLAELIVVDKEYDFCKISTEEVVIDSENPCPSV